MKTPYADKVERFCNQHSMDLAEYLLLERIAEDFSLSRGRLLRRTAIVFEQSSQSRDFPNFRCDNWNKPCDALLAKNLLAQVNSNYVNYITDYLAANPALGPALRLPRKAELDLTLQSAALWKEFEGWTATNPKPLACRFEKTPSLVQLFGSNREFLNRFLEDLLEGETDFPGSILSISEPIAIGMWRSRWWETFDNGWVIEVELTPEDD